MHWFLFIVSGLIALAIPALFIASKFTDDPPTPPPPKPDLSFWDIVSGEADKKIEIERAAETASQLAPFYFFVFWVATTAFAVYQGVQIWGNK